LQGETKVTGSCVAAAVPQRSAIATNNTRFTAEKSDEAAELGAVSVLGQAEVSALLSWSE
jgi:hypothetical protein